MIQKTKELYGWLWQDMTLFGRATLFPIIVIMLPIMLFIVLCMKD